MRLRFKKVIFTIIMTLVVCMIGKSVFAASAELKYQPEAYKIANYLFCSDHSKALAFTDDNGNPELQLLYNVISSGNVEVEPSTGYAFWKTKVDNQYDAAAIQNVIWASKQWNNASNVLEQSSSTVTTKGSNNAVEARSYQYGTVYYNIISKLNSKELFKVATDENNLKVLVDQYDKTYTVGPYKIELGVNDASQEAKQILYNEIISNGNQGFTTANQFAKFDSITGVNGTNIKFMNSNGSEIAFPDFVNGQEFYIRFNPDNNGEITQTGTPIINVKYLKSFTGNIYKYSSEGLKYNVSFDNAEITNVKDRRVDQNDSNHYYATATVTGKLTINDGKNEVSWTVDVPLGNVKVHTYANGYRLNDVPNEKWSPLEEVNTNKEVIVNNSNAENIQNYVQGLVTISNPSETPENPEKPVTPGTPGTPGVKENWENAKAVMPSKQIEMCLGGNVWQDLPENKTGKITGVKGQEDKIYSGMQVSLYDQSGNLIKTTITDSNGQYKFTGLNPLMKYFVKFTYNGEMYQATYYKNYLGWTGGYSNAKDEQRESFNNKFGTIYSDPKNYEIGTSWRKSYAILGKLEKEDGSYISYNQGALTYEDAFNKFREFVISKKSYDGAYSETKSWLMELGVGNTESDSIITFIKDCMITAKTQVNYPVYDQFVLEDINNPGEGTNAVVELDKKYSYLYTKKSDQSRYVDFGITPRENSDLALQKDVYKATIIVNGKSQEYIYNKKTSHIDDDYSWDITVRASDELYNGKYSYTREVRKSEYLYDGSDVGGTDAKNLQVYITYRIAVKNLGDVTTSVNEIVDYYDADKYEVDGTRGTNGVYDFKTYNNYDSNGNIINSYINSYIGKDSKGTMLDSTSLKVSDNTSFKDRTLSETIKSQNYNYSTVYLTGIKSTQGSDKLNPGEMAYAYITFKAKTDKETGKVQLDEELNSGIETIGKRNIAEINGYSTYYKPNSTIPNELKDNNETVDTPVQGKIAGLIDKNSNSGNLSSKDLNSDGDIITSTNIVENRLENDTDKAPNIKLIIDTKSEDNRSFTGYVYEDARTQASNKAVVGNGKYDENEAKINGVTVELVELVQDVDDNGIFKGNYLGEKVWGSRSYTISGNTIVAGNEDFTRYYSGSGKAKIVLSGTGIFSIDTFDVGEGSYGFTSVPTGDFYIRFTYGDNNQTVLTNDSNSEVNKVLETAGLNAKSYNGQDFKTTTYQAGIDQNSNYNGINGYIDYNTQNYTNENEKLNKTSMYYYDIDKSSKQEGVSDAKDIYNYRINTNNWCGADGTIELNNKAEILASYEKLGTYKYENADGSIDTKKRKLAQESMINNLIQNTKMVAQTGIINTEVEYNTKQTDNQGNSNNKTYSINDIDLGLEERPEAQLKLTKEVTNFKLLLANNQTLFDTNQSVNNVYYAKHNGHKVEYTAPQNLRLSNVSINASNVSEKPELIQTYIDDELMEGATLNLTYKLTVENVGEVDYLDKEFYYTGKTSDASERNISTTTANSLIDYVSNMIKYDKNYQDVNANWILKSASELTNSAKVNNNVITIDESKIGSDIINREYYEKLLTYNTMLSTDKINAKLLPTVAEKGNSKAETSLVLSTMISNNNGVNNLVYNNLSEITSTSNVQGRRMQYSIVGNQDMADQSLGNNAKQEIYSNVDLVTPTEIDADSAQKVVLMPPTGENKNYLPMILGIMSATLIIIAGIVIIKKRVVNNK